MKTVLITGATGDIGSSMVRIFTNNGYNVVAHYNKNEENALLLKKETGCVLYKADLSDEKQILEMADFLKKKYQGVDILINNAGVCLQKMLCDTSTDDWDFVFDINIKGVFILTKALMETMVHNKWGRIINISSIWGEVGASCEVAYSASKAALIGFTKALAKELSLSGICVNCITPGVIDTKMNDIIDPDDMEVIKNEIPMQRLGRPEEIANVALFLSGEKSNYITGQTIGVNGGENM